MNITGRLYLLYQPDQRVGDCLLKPLRWSEHQWHLLAGQMEIRNPCQLFSACVKVALFIVPTLVAAIFAMIGIALKACSDLPPIAIPPLEMFPEEIHEMPPEEVYVGLRRNSPSATASFSPLYKDLVVYVAIFLSRQEQLSLAGASKGCYQNIDSLVLWREQLASVRIWGATAEQFNYDSKQGKWISNLKGWKEISPLTQLRTYYRLNLKDSFLDYIARLMPGGPIAFSRIPKFTAAVDVYTLSPGEMGTSLAMGVDDTGRKFFALKLLDRSTPATPSQKMLVFCQEKRMWKCEWEHGKLSSSDQNTINYVLALIRREDLTLREEFSSPPYRTNVELYSTGS